MVISPNGTQCVCCCCFEICLQLWRSMVAGDLCMDAFYSISPRFWLYTFEQWTR